MQNVEVPVEAVKNLKEKVESMSRFLVGSGARKNQNQVDDLLMSKELGLDHRLCSDGFDEIARSHKVPELSRKELLHHFHDVINQLDNISSESSKLFDAKYNAQVIVPVKLTQNPADIPASTVSILTPEVEEAQKALTQGAQERNVPQGKPPALEIIASQVGATCEASSTMLKNALRSVKGGTGVKKQSRRVFEPGWQDVDAERYILGELLVSKSARGVVETCQGMGLRPQDFRIPDHEKIFEVALSIKDKGKQEIFKRGLLDGVGDQRKQLMNRLEQVGKTNQSQNAQLSVPLGPNISIPSKTETENLQDMVSSVLLKARLRRLVHATKTGNGLKQEPAPAPQPARPPVELQPSTQFKPGAVPNPTTGPPAKPGMPTGAPPAQGPGAPKGGMPPGRAASSGPMPGMPPGAYGGMGTRR